jgi:fructokinase
MANRAHVLCIGEALWDLLPTGRVPGGAPMNVALRLAAFGARSRLLTRVGCDDAGRELVSYMEGLGLDTSHIQFDAERPTGYVAVDTRDLHAPRYDIAAPVAWDFIDADEYLAQSDEPVDVVVYGSLAARHSVARDSQFRLLEHARLRIFDVNRRPPFDDRELIERLLAVADWAKVNEDELAHVQRWHGLALDIPDAIRWLAEHYELDVVCVTLGAGGAMLLRNGHLYPQAAFEVEVVDTIGCGDAFLGALLAGLLDGGDPAAALERACAAGAIVARHAGGNPELREDDIRAMLEQGRR